MTVILMQKTKSKVTLFADGRITSDGGFIIGNTSEKIIKVNQNIILAVAGFAPDNEIISDLLFECKTARECVEVLIEASEVVLPDSDSTITILLADSLLNVYELVLPYKQVLKIKDNVLAIGSGSQYIYGILSGKKTMHFTEFCKAIKYLSANRDSTIGGKCNQMEVKYEKVD
jgi:20S proteasome alpha/beta subunit